jgi:hypothetical protein
MHHPPMTFVLDVGFTTVRPVIPDQHHARVVVSVHDEIEATLVAAQIVACGRAVEMVTSTAITDYWI